MPQRRLDRLLTLPRAPFTALLVVLAATALLQVALAALRRWRVRRRLRRQQTRATAGEARAERMLQALGYAVVGRQVPVAYSLHVNGEAVPVRLRADYLVTLGGRRFVAEVKTGRLAPRLDNSATRRQLLEYRLAFAVDGVLLVDADAGRVDAVSFPGHAAPSPGPGAWRLLWLAVGLLAGFAAASAR